MTNNPIIFKPVYEFTLIISIRFMFCSWRMTGINISLKEGIMFMHNFIKRSPKTTRNMTRSEHYITYVYVYINPFRSLAATDLKLFGFSMF